MELGVIFQIYSNMMILPVGSKIGIVFEGPKGAQSQKYLGKKMM